mgnify:CR=1 FL=1
MALTVTPNGWVPACVVHDCITVAPTPNLAGRLARCDHYGRGGFRNHGPIYGGGTCSRTKCECIAPSSLELPFFEFQGESSPYALEHCGCGFAVTAHGAYNAFTGRPGITDHAPVPRGPASQDRFYCGCAGWD